MVALWIGLALLAGTTFGWYAHKAWLRIDEWGRRRNDLDHIAGA